MTRRSQLGGFVLRAASRLCGPRALEHVVQPTVADLQHECLGRTEGQNVRPNWRTVLVLLRGYWACWSAVTRIWLLGFDEPADVAPSAATLLRRTLGLAVGLTIAVETLFFIGGNGMIERVWRQAGGLAVIDVSILKAPSDLVVLIAPALLAAVLAAGASLRQHARGVLAVSFLTAVTTFALWAWAAPIANHAFRQHTAGYIGSHEPVSRGANEMSIGELPSGIERAYASLPAERRRSRLYAELNVRLALPAACLSFGFLGWTLSYRTHSGRRGALQTGAIVLVVSVAWLLLFVAGLSWARLGVAPAIGIWGANVVLALAATAAWLASRRRASLVGRAG